MEIYMVNDLEPYGLSMIFLVGGIPTPLKNDGVSNSWDDDIPNKKQIHVPKHQPVIVNPTIHHFTR